MRAMGVAVIMLAANIAGPRLGAAGDDDVDPDVDALQEPPCGPPEPIEHGLTDWEGRGSVARYACFQGYHLVGPAYVECRYGQWYSKATVAPVCQPIFCNEPNIEHGDVVRPEGRRKQLRASTFGPVCLPKQLEAIMVDLGGYVIILVETADKHVKLYGSPAEKSDLEVADEILEINGESLERHSHTEVIAHIHKCIRSRTICLRVKRRTGNRLARELSESSHVQDAFVIAVEQRAKERLERLSALRKIKPVDMTKLSQQLCESAPDGDLEQIEQASEEEEASEANSDIVYSAKVSELQRRRSRRGSDSFSSSNKSSGKRRSSSRKSDDGAVPSGHVTDEELELTQNLAEMDTVTELRPSDKEGNGKGRVGRSPSKEVLISDTGSRRSSKASLANGTNTISSNNNPRSSLTESSLRPESTEELLCSFNSLLPMSQVSTSHLRSLLELRRQILNFCTKDNSKLAPMCNDARLLLQEVVALLQLHLQLPESAPLLATLQTLHLEGLLFAHDKIAAPRAPSHTARPFSFWADVEQAKADNETVKEDENKEVKEKNETKPDVTQNNLDTRPQNSRIVQIVKNNEPLGATVRNEGERVVIGRVVSGGAAARSGQLHPGDEVVEVNGLRLKGRSVHDICDSLCQMTGTLVFTIIPRVENCEEKEEIASKNAKNEEILHVRAHFAYNPDDDLYIPCHELGVAFERGDILHVINTDDKHWWQAYKDNESNQSLAGLIPSLSLQQHRMNLQRQKIEQERKNVEENKIKESEEKSENNKSLLCAGRNSRRRRNKDISPNSIDNNNADVLAPPYENVSLLYPQANERRPLILIASASGIARHELRLRLLEDSSKFAAAVPHTSRLRNTGEIDGQDYHFVSRSQFDEDVSNARFVEHGEFEKQMYGTSLDAVRTVINSGKICVLNLQPQSLLNPRLRQLRPYVVCLRPPTPQVFRQEKLKYGQLAKEEEYYEGVARADELEEQLGHCFDSVIPFDTLDYVFDQIIFEMRLLESEPQWVPSAWIDDHNNNNANH